MKLLLICSFVLLTVVALQTDEASWNDFKEKYSKTYKSFIQEKIRFSIFQSNLRNIENHNKKYENGEETYFLRINKFSDLTREELERKFNGFQDEQFDYLKSFELPEDSQVPLEIDWRDRGAVLQVMDQGDCGSCWAFSALGSIEGQNAIKHNKTVLLSEQELIDCSYGYGNLACEGGTMIRSFKYIKKFGITTAKSYPYEGKHNKDCRRVTDSDIKVTGFIEVNENETALMEAVGTVGPVTTAISSYDIAYYGGGIFNKADCSKRLNHGVLVVGYGTSNGTDYWIVKNSWGADWGEKGFIKMSRNKGNQCGIGRLNSYPIIE